MRGRPRVEPELGLLPRPVREKPLRRPVWPPEEYEKPPDEQLALVFNIVSKDSVDTLKKPEEVHVEMQKNGSKFDGRILILNMANGLLDFYVENPGYGIRVGDHLRFRLTEELRNGELSRLFWDIRGGSRLRQTAQMKARLVAETPAIVNIVESDFPDDSLREPLPTGIGNTGALVTMMNELDISTRNLRRHLPGTLITADKFISDPMIATEPRMLLPP
jgi:hypothetical protein